MFTIVCGINILIVLILAIITVFLWIKFSKKLKYGTVIVGEVVDVKVTENAWAANQDGLPTISIIPKIKYVVQGKEYLFEPRTFSPSWKAGKLLKVLYNNNNPDEANLVLSFALPVIVLTILFVVFLLVLVLLLVLFYNGLINF